MGQQTQRPSAPAVGGSLRAGQPNQVRLALPIQLALLLPVGLFAIDRFLQTFLLELAAQARSRSLTDLHRFDSAGVRPPWPLLAFVELQKQPHTGLFAGRAASAPDQFEEVSTLFGGEADVILFVHSGGGLSWREWHQIDTRPNPKYHT
jgi:hypothetical protein